MTTLALNKISSSNLRVKKFRDNMIKQGFKRVQKWVCDLESVTLQKQLKKDLKNYKNTKDSEEWDQFIAFEVQNIKDWK